MKVRIHVGHINFQPIVEVFFLNPWATLDNVVPGRSLDMYICIHVRDKGIYSRGI